MKTSLKEVKITARYAHKTNGKFNGMVTYAVRSSNGEVIYCTTLINGKASGCSCPSHKPCYHMHQLEEREWARYRAEVARKMAAQYVSAETVKQIAEQLVAPAQVKKVALAVVSPSKKRDMMNAPLTRNKAFSLLKEAV